MMRREGKVSTLSSRVSLLRGGKVAVAVRSSLKKVSVSDIPLSSLTCSLVSFSKESRVRVLHLFGSCSVINSESTLSQDDSCTLTATNAKLAQLSLSKITRF